MAKKIILKICLFKESPYGGQQIERGNNQNWDYKLGANAVNEMRNTGVLTRMVTTEMERRQRVNRYENLWQ